MIIREIMNEHQVQQLQVIKSSKIWDYYLFFIRIKISD